MAQLGVYHHTAITTADILFSSKCEQLYLFVIIQLCMLCSLCFRNDVIAISRTCCHDFSPHYSNSHVRHVIDVHVCLFLSCMLSVVIHLLPIEIQSMIDFVNIIDLQC